MRSSSVSRFAMAGLALTSLGLAGCGGGAQPTRPTAGIRRPPPQVSTVTPSQWVEQSASSSLYAIRASEMMAARSSDYGLRAFAQTVVRDHEGISGQVAFAGRRLDVLPSATLLPLHQSMIDQLVESGGDNATYKRQLRSVLASQEALHRSYAATGSSPTLRPVSQMAAPILTRELGELGRL